MADIVKEPVLVRRRASNPKPKYHESGYQRPLIQRFTPFTWFVIVFIISCVIIVSVFIANKVSSASQATSIMLPDLLATTEGVNPTSLALTAAVPVLPSPYPAKSIQQSSSIAHPDTPTPQPTPTQTPSPTPTTNPNDAPWANQLIQQPNRTLMAPPQVVNKAISDLSGYYTRLKNLSLDDYMRERFDLLDTYFTGQALAQLRQQENNRTQYAMYRAGKVIIEVQSFSSDGYSAVAGVTRKGWVTDIYDVTSRKIISSSVSVPDSLAVMSITFDRSNGRWKFATLDPDSEATK